MAVELAAIPCLTGWCCGHASPPSLRGRRETVQELWEGTRAVAAGQQLFLRAVTETRVMLVESDSCAVLLCPEVLFCPEVLSEKDRQCRTQRRHVCLL